MATHSQLKATEAVMTSKSSKTTIIIHDRFSAKCSSLRKRPGTSSTANPRVQSLSTSIRRKSKPRSTRRPKKNIEKAFDEWDEKNDEALRIISFTAIERLQGPIRYGNSAKGGWDELQKFHAPKGKHRKYSLLRRLYRLDMKPNTLLRDHEEAFDVLVLSLSAIGKNIDPDGLIIVVMITNRVGL